MMAQWSAHEDEQLRKLVKEYGPKRWSIIASKLKTKGSKQCRRRWKNHLNADLKSGGWTAEEDRILMEGHRLYGNRWTEIAKMVGGRTDNAVKNRYAALCKRDSRGTSRGGAARGGRGARKARVSDSDGGASDVEVDVDDDSDDAEETKRTSSSSISREPSPPRASRGTGRGESGAAHCTPVKRGTPPSGSPLRPGGHAAGGAAGGELASGATGGSSSVLGRRRQPAAGACSPPLQPEADAAAPAKRRMLLSGGLLSGGSTSSGVSGGRQLMASSLQPRMPAAAAQDSPDVHFDQHQHLHSRAHANQAPQQPWQTPAVADSVQQERVVDVVASVWQQHLPEEAALPQAEAKGGPGQQPAVASQRAGSQDGRLEGAGGSGSAQPKKLPLTINIPNAASAEPQPQQPPTTSGGLYGIEIRVLRDLLTPCELQYARELNDMQLPLHINVDDEPSSLLIHRTNTMAVGASGASLLGAAGGGSGGGGTSSSGGGSMATAAAVDPPLSTSRQAAQNALTALFSPGCATAGAMADFNDVLKWFQTGLTPRSTFGGGVGDDGTPRLMGRMGMTPCGLGGGRGAGRGGEDDEARMLGTGLTPKCLLGGSSPRGNGSGAGGGAGGLAAPLCDPLASSPSKRTRRQIAVAAAVAAAAAEPQRESTHEAVTGAAGMRDTAAGGGSGGGGGGGFMSGVAMSGLFSPASGMELHAGHRQLLTKLIQTAAAEANAGSTGGGGSCSGSVSAGDIDVGLRTDGGRLRLPPPSPSEGLLVHHDPFGAHGGGAADGLMSAGGFGPSTAAPVAGISSAAPEAADAAGPSGQISGNDALGSGGSSGSGGVLVMPYFTQQELMMLLEVLNSEDLQALPPPPPQQQQQQQQQH